MRGYSRKGAALSLLGKYEEAIKVYATGLTHDPKNSGLHQAKNSAEAKLAAGDRGGSSSSQFPDIPLSGKSQRVGCLALP